VNAVLTMGPLATSMMSITMIRRVFLRFNMIVS
jgi:hypothetical protein